MRVDTASLAGAPDLSLEASRAKLLGAIGPAADVVFVRGHGNVGDDLIYAGTRQLLSGISYREASVLRLHDVRGEVGLLSGSGAWCATYHAMPSYLREVEERFERVIILPSSFDIRVEGVRDALRKTKAKVFARERISFNQIRDICDTDLAHDTALYFDYRPYQRIGQGVLTAYRVDAESVGRDLPANNDDISMTCEGLDEFLWNIARHELIRTDRAHVAIAGAMLGKRVEYGTSNYHKVPAIVEFSLRALPVVRVEESPASDFHAADGNTEKCSPRIEKSEVNVGNFRHMRETARRSHMEWLHALRRAREEIESLVPPDQTLIFVDDNQWGREPIAPGRRVLPFLEKEGVFWGPPPDDATAIRELERMRAEGANYLIFAWPGFWWLDHYSAFCEYVFSRYRCIWRNDRLRAVDLRTAPAASVFVADAPAAR